MSNLYCPNFKAALTATTPEGKKLAVAGRCKQWSCKFCARKNRERWQAILLKYVNGSDCDWSWFTLTAHPNTHGMVDPAYYTLLNIKNSWDRLTKRMKRKYGKFQYCRVYEKHKSGAFHLHCIRSGVFDDIVARNAGKKNEYNDSRWLRETASALGMGYMTHADNLERKKRGLVVFYVAKYMTKFSSGDKESWRGVRRIQTSRGIKYKGESEYVWDFKSGLYLAALGDGEDTYYLLNEKRLLSNDDFIDDFVWPPTKTMGEDDE